MERKQFTADERAFYCAKFGRAAGGRTIRHAAPQRSTRGMADFAE